MTSPRDATILFISCLAMILPRGAFAGVVVNLENSATPGMRKIDALPGQTFWIDVNVDMDRQIFGVACKLAASQGNVFDILDVSSNNRWTVDDSSIISGVDPESGRLRSFLSGAEYVGPGSSMVASLHIGVAPTAARGTYELAPSNVWYWDGRLNPSQVLAVAGPPLTVEVLPEPACILTFGFSLILLGVRRVQPM